MDHERNQQASSSSSQANAASSSTNNTDRAPLRCSSRLRAARDKEREGSALELSTKRNRDQSGKGKAKDAPSDSASAPVRTSKRTRRAVTQPSTLHSLVINEPAKDPKGKKRAIQESVSEDERLSGASSSKRQRRLKKDKDSNQQMQKKSKMPSKGKTSAKGKSAPSPGPSRPLDDGESMDVDFTLDSRGDEDEQMHEDEHQMDEHIVNEGDKSDDDDESEDEGEKADEPSGETSLDHRRTIEETMSLFDFGRLGGYMSQLNSRLRTLLNDIKPSADSSSRLIALQELSEILSISTEDTLAGSFQVEDFVRELVRILGGNGGDAAQDDDENDEDAAIAAAIALSTGGDESLEAQLLACRCLANLMEALPGCGHTLVYHGAIPVLCSKLLEISYIDLAEQTLLTLEKISEEYPSAIVRDGGLAALLNFLDFFSIVVQRTAVQAAANCCRSISPEYFPKLREVWPIIRNCLGYADQRLVDFASQCVIRVIDSYHRSHADKLELLVDADLIRAVNILLLPAGGSPVIPANTCTLLMKSMATAARASPTIALALLQADVVTTVYQILTGVAPPADSGSEQGNAESGQGLGGGIADMTIMQNLAHRPKEQVEEALTLVSELMPPLPKDGTFDYKGYSERVLYRMIAKAKVRSDRASRAAANAIAALPGGQSPQSSRAHSPTGGPSTPAEDEAGTPASAPAEVSEVPPSVPTTSAPAKDAPVDRTELLRQHQQVVNRFMGLILPILVDVYTASVSVPIRIKCLAAILKVICFQDEEQLKLTLKNVPISSFASSILSAKDHPNLMIGGLQMVELLLMKVPDFKASFRREGVLHEIEVLAARPLTPRIKEKEKVKEESKDPDVLPPPELVDVSIPIPPPITIMPSSRRSLDSEDTYTLRARVIRFKYLQNDVESEGDASFLQLRRIVEGLKQPAAQEEQCREVLRDLANIFSSPHTTVSSFELLQSGLVDALLEFSTNSTSAVDLQFRQKAIVEELMSYKGNSKKAPATTPMSILVKKLHESLTRMESFEVTTLSPGIEDSKRNSPSLLARSIRLRLVPEESSDGSRPTSSNIIVSIQAIATFQALNDYLRPRLSGILSTMSGSRLSGMLSALAAGRLPPELLAGGLGLPSSSSQSSLPEPDSTSSIDEPKPERRRSLRLSAKASANSLSEKNTASSSAVPPASTASSSTVSAPHVHEKTTLSDFIALSNASLGDDDDDIGNYMDTEVDAEIIEDGDDGVAEKTVNLSVADDGSKVEAQTPDGTRVATPNPNSAGVGSSSGAQSQRPSYAAAVKTRPSDWHLEFAMDGHVLPLDMTIYGAIHQHETRKSPGGVMPTNIWSRNDYTVKYKKVSGPRPVPDASDAAIRARSPVSILASLPDDAPHSKILKLLRVFHNLNVAIADDEIIGAQPLSENAFVNNKLTAKLTRQLEEPMIVASSILPDWAMDLPLHFPFLFPFTTRFSFLQSTSFGYARLIMKWQSQNRAQESSRRDESFNLLGRLQRQKVRISRNHVLESAFKVFELYGSSSSILEVEYFDEAGTGLGPTLEFYSMVSREFARRDLKIWKDADSSYPGVYVHHPTGLFPAPVSSDHKDDVEEKRTYVFRIIGQFVAKAMLDSRIIDMTFNKVFLKLVLGMEVPLTIANLRHVDPTLANSLTKIQAFADQTTANGVKSGFGTIEDMMLDFTLPGYDIEIRPGGRDIPVTSENVNEYIHEVIDATIGKGVEPQMKAFREGFSKVFPVTDLQAFSADELGLVFGSAEEDWSIETLSEAMKADHGFNVESSAIRHLMQIMSEYDGPSRRSFLQFITGSPKLPIGGFRGLNPPLTVVRKPHESPYTPDDYLPSVMTCVNYLKLPQYSSKEVMREKLFTAMNEGVGSFHLS